MSNLEPIGLFLYRPLEVPQEVLDFWMARVADQDRAMALTGGHRWYRMMTGEEQQNGIVAVWRGEDGRPRAVLPLIRTRWRARWSLPGLRGSLGAVPALRACGGDLLEDGLGGAEFAAMLRGVHRHEPRAGVIWFDHVHAGRRLNLLRDGARRSRSFFCADLFSDIPHFRLVLPATVEGFRQLRSAKSLKKIRGRERSLEREVGGACRVIEMRKPADWDPYRHVIAEMMNRTWQARRLGHTFRVADMATHAERGWLRSFLLMAGDRPAAFALCYQGEGVLVYEKIGYDEAFDRHSPGTILLYRLIERLYEQDRPGIVDFGEGEADYKQALASEVVRVHAVLVVRKSLGWQMRFQLFALSRRADAVLRRSLEAVGIARLVSRRLRRMPDAGRRRPANAVPEAVRAERNRGLAEERSE